MLSNMGRCNRFCQLIEMLFTKLHICLIKTTILIWCTWMSVKYLAYHYMTLWLRSKNHAKLTWYTVTGVKTAFHSVIISSFVIVTWTAWRSAPCCLFICLFYQWPGWTHTFLIDQVLSRYNWGSKKGQFTDTIQSWFLWYGGARAGLLMGPNIKPQPDERGQETLPGNSDATKKAVALVGS